MEFEELVKVWREEETGEVRRTRVESLSELRGRATREEVKMRRHFRRATIVWLACAAWFAFWMAVSFLRGDLLRVTAATILVVGCIAPAVYLTRAKRTEIDPTLPIRMALMREIDRLRELRRVIRAMINWVAGALAVGGSMLAVPAASDDLLYAAAWAAGFTLFGIWGWKAWRRFANRLQPTIDELEGWIADLERI